MPTNHNAKKSQDTRSIPETDTLPLNVDGKPVESVLGANKRKTKKQQLLEAALGGVEKRLPPKGEGRDKYKPEYCQALIKHMASGLTITSFAATIHCAYKTIARWCDDFPEFREAREIGESAYRLWWEKQGQHLATGKHKGSGAVWIFSAKNNLGYRDRAADEAQADNEAIAQRLSILAEALKTGSKPTADNAGSPQTGEGEEGR